MTKSKYTTIVCILIVCAGAVLALLFMYSGLFSPAEEKTAEYVGFFDTSYVHTIDIQADASEWNQMLENAMQEEYIPCDVTIDGEQVLNVAIRPKGNTSLSTVSSMDSDRYSFKIEFDHYSDGNTYKGLDKLALNNIIQDTTYMKDYLTYTMMNYMGAYAPLCSYVYITVNGEEWGLYLAVEGIEEAFAERNFGSNYGKIYKPDHMSMGGGDMDQNRMQPPDMEDGNPFAQERQNRVETQGQEDTGGPPAVGENMTPPAGMEASADGAVTPPEQEAGEQQAENGGMPSTGQEQMQRGGGGFGGPGGNAQDVALQYIDDDPESYSNIFDQNVFDTNSQDENRLIQALKLLNAGDVEDSVNVDEVLRYFVVHNFVNNFDSYTGNMGHNYYLYEEDGKLSMIAWDYNLAFGAFDMGGGFGRGEQGSTQTDSATQSINYPIDTPVSGVSMEDRPLLNQLLSNPEYLALYHSYMDTFISEYFESGYFTQEIDRVITMITPYVQKDPSAFYTFEEFTLGSQTLKTYCTLRAQSIRGQLNGEIPSTQEGQAADTSTRIDGSQISISDMGSQGGGRGGAPEMRNPMQDAPTDQGNTGMQPADSGVGQGEQRADAGGDPPTEDNSMQGAQTAQGHVEPFDGQEAESADTTADGGQETASEQPQQAQNQANAESDTRGSFDRNSGGMDFPGQAGGQSESWTVYLPVGISALAILLGILFAACYKRRR